jgi:hypothetical protein
MLARFIPEQWPASKSESMADFRRNHQLGQKAGQV